MATCWEARGRGQPSAQRQDGRAAQASGRQPWFAAVVRSRGSRGGSQPWSAGVVRSRGPHTWSAAVVRKPWSNQYLVGLDDGIRRGDLALFAPASVNLAPATHLAWQLFWSERKSLRGRRRRAPLRTH